MLTRLMIKKTKTMTIASLATVIAVFSLVVPAYADIVLTGAFPMFVHSGDEIDKDVTVTAFNFIQTEPLTITHSNDCGNDLAGNPVLTITPAEITGVVFGQMVTFNERVTGMPGNYHCDVTITVTDEDGTGDSEGEIQEVWIEVLGTIGYWSHHPTEVTSLLPITLGDDPGTDDTADHVVDSIGKAQAILDLKSGKNAHNKLAAQQLVAELNKAAGVSDTTCVDANIDDGDEILDDAGYSGPNSTTAPMKSAKAPVTATADALDDFNNNGCP